MVEIHSKSKISNEKIYELLKEPPPAEIEALADESIQHLL
jgi:hypothetical protein